MNKRSGYSLVELLLVLAILSIMIIGAVGIFNPVFQVNKAKDAKRKKDLYKIRTAMEDYFADKKHYPPPSLVTDLMSPLNCDSRTVFDPWLTPWPCDYGSPYKILIEQDDRGQDKEDPGWFKILTNLDNKKDEDIPNNWYSEYTHKFVGFYTNNEVNFGVSSTNVSWYDNYYYGCNRRICVIDTGGDCEGAGGNRCVTDGDSECFFGSCTPMCKTDCCGRDCD